MSGSGLKMSGSWWELVGVDGSRWEWVGVDRSGWKKVEVGSTGWGGGGARFSPTQNLIC